MRNVKRLKIPPKSLKNNANKWKKTLLEKIDELNNTGEKVPDSYYNHYIKDDIKMPLINMYKGLCCYCESRVDSVIDETEDDGKKKYGHIEHLKPKKKFPQNCYDWENLHLACADCNITKADKYDNKNPILDPVKDKQIENYYTFELVGIGLHFNALKERAETTEKHVNLNRSSLLINRLEVYHNVINAFREWNKLKNDVEKRAKIRQLEKLAEGQYGSVINWALNDLFSINTGV